MKIAFRILFILLCLVYVQLQRASAQCVVNGDCDDLVACTVDTCNTGVPGGACVFTPTDALCDDGSVCTGTETCDGVLDCQIGTPLNCDDAVLCTDDACDSITGCSNTVNDANCDDGSVCTGTETCDGVLDCQVGTPLDCDDAVLCTDDACDSITGCSNTVNDANCDDGSVCTGTETCDGVLDCQVGTPLNCDDAVLCTDDACDSITGCSNTVNDANCDDASVCTGIETCDGVLDCQVGTPLDCDDAVLCTDDACDSITGCSNTINDANCDDASVCTGIETCDGVLDCQVGTPLDCDDAVLCTDDACDSITGCSNTINDANCDDGSVCTGIETCNGVLDCQAGTPLDCDDVVLCTDDACDSITGCSNTPNDGNCNDLIGCTDDVCDGALDCQFTPNNGNCNDGVACTDDACDAVLDCQFTPNNGNCDDFVACTDDVCDTILDCQFTANDANCNDADACTLDSCNAVTDCFFTTVVCNDTDLCTIDTCVSGVCLFIPISCNDDDACTVDQCVGGTCSNTPAFCNDGNACTIDTCDSVIGCTTTPLVCNDGSVCTTDGCSPITGCTVTPIVCNDGNACTTDGCDSLSGCTISPLVCNDGDACTTDGCDTLTGCTTTPVNCDDGDLCTDDFCVGGCVNTPVDCNDNNACTIDQCVLGSCTHSIFSCDDGNACTTDSCDTFSGCTTTPVICDDGSVCTTDGCSPITGCTVTPIVCNDGDACTTDGCDSLTGCTTTPLVCNDGDACTTDGCDTLTGCTTTPLSCDDLDLCTTDSCSSVTGCINTLIICDDGNVCNGLETCNSLTGFCQAGTPIYPVLSFDYQNGCLGDTTYVTNLSVGVDPAANYYLDTGTLNFPPDFGPIPASSLPTDSAVILPIPPGNTHFTVIVVNPSGCSDTISINIFLLGCDDNSACTIDSCFSQPTLQCSHTPIPPCNDNDFCTANGCDSVTGCVFTQLPVPKPDFITSDVCLGQANSFTNKTTVPADPGLLGSLSYVWDFGDGASSTDLNPVHLYSTFKIDTVTLTATTNSGCSHDTSITHIVFPLPFADFRMGGSCYGSNISVANLDTMTGYGFIQFYHWDFGDGTSSDDSIPVKAYNTLGTFQITHTATSDQGCMSSISKTTTVFSNPIANFIATSVCDGDTTEFTNLSSLGAGTLSYTWDFGDGLNSIDENPVHRYAGDGTYSVTVTAKSDTMHGSCSTSKIKDVQVYPLPTVEFSVSPVCEGEISVFNNTSSVHAPYTIILNNWNFGDGGASLDIAPTHLYDSAGTYLVTLMLTTDKGCVNSGSEAAVVNHAPEVFVSHNKPLAFCRGDDVTLFALAFPPPPINSYTYEWTTSANDSFITVTTAGSYCVTVTDQNNCVANACETVTVYVIPIVTAAANPDKISKGFPVQLMAEGGVSYQWTADQPDAGLSDPNIQDPTATPQQTTTFTVTATDAQGCQNTATVTVTVVPDYQVDPINVITPNGDAFNQTWVINNILTYTDNEVLIFDRWGTKVFDMKAYDNSWDGTYNGKDLPQGTYYYVIKFDGNDRLYKGSVSIIR